PSSVLGQTGIESLGNPLPKTPLILPDRSIQTLRRPPSVHRPSLRCDEKRGGTWIEHIGPYQKTTSRKAARSRDLRPGYLVSLSQIPRDRRARRQRGLR